MTRKKCLTVQQIAQRLAVSERTVQRLIASGRIQAFRPGSRALRVWERDFDTYLAGQDTASAR